VASALGMAFRRIQFTPDLMPPDIVGTRMLDLDESGGRQFRFERGPIFANVVLADEINRATPRTQSALLEAMQERQVTIFGDTIPLEEPFFVIATQNPIEMEGTYPLPEAHLDRFLLKIELGAPGLDEMVSILGATTGARPPSIEPVVAAEEVRWMQELVREVPAGSEELRLASRLVLATHPTGELTPEGVRRYVRYGASPRGGQALLMAAKARALVEGRLSLATADLERIAAPALRHRLILNYEGEAAGIEPDALVAEALESARRAAGDRSRG
jgi:MoxR-like ATPase